MSRCTHHPAQPGESAEFSVKSRDTVLVHASITRRKTRAEPRASKRNVDMWVLPSRKGYRNHLHQNEWFGVYICDRILYKKFTKVD